MRQSTIDKYGRHILVFWGIVFAVIAYILWKDVIVEHQCPDNLNGWFGIILAPLVSLISLGTAIFYSPAKTKAVKPHVEQPEKTKKDNSILDWEKLRNQPPLIQAISVSSLAMLVVMFFTMQQYFITVPWFTYVAFAGGICLVLGMFLYSYKGLFQTFCKYLCGFVLIAFFAFIVTVFVGMNSSNVREWKDLEVVSYQIRSREGRLDILAPRITVEIDNQIASVYIHDPSLIMLSRRYGTDFNDSVTVDLTARQIVPHFYVKPHAKIKPKAANAATPTID